MSKKSGQKTAAKKGSIKERLSVSIIDQETIAILRRIEADTGLSAAAILGALSRGYTFVGVKSKPFTAASKRGAK